MNGDDLLLDTNAFIYFFEGRPAVAERVLLAETLYCSVITEIELLSARHLTEEERTTIRAFLACQRIELNPDVVERTIELRRSERLKTPIIVATALHLGRPSCDGRQASGAHCRLADHRRRHLVRAQATASSPSSSKCSTCISATRPRATRRSRPCSSARRE